MARARLDALRPKAIVCNGCAAELTAIEQVEVAGIPGLDAVFVARCEACDAETLSAQGSPEALNTLAEHMRATTAPGNFVGARYEGHGSSGEGTT